MYSCRRALESEGADFHGSTDNALERKRRVANVNGAWLLTNVWSVTEAHRVSAAIYLINED